MARKIIPSSHVAGKGAPVRIQFEGPLARVARKPNCNSSVAANAARILGFHDMATALRMLDGDKKHSIRADQGPQEHLICSEPGRQKPIFRSQSACSACAVRPDPFSSCGRIVSRMSAWFQRDDGRFSAVSWCFARGTYAPRPIP